MTRQTNPAAKAAAETEKRAAENSALPALSAAELDAARKEGAKEDVKETAKDQHRALTDGNLPGAPPQHQFTGSDEIMQYAHLIALPLEELKRVIDPETSYGIPEEKIAGLLKLERNGQNRTDYVKALLDRLPIDHVRDLPGAGGPDYTNDTTPITALDKR